MNDNFGIVIICPFSSKIKKYAGCIFLNKSEKNGLKTDSEIISFQVRAISKDRLIEKWGEIEKTELKETLKVLNEVLEY